MSGICLRAQLLARRRSGLRFAREDDDGKSEKPLENPLILVEETGLHPLQPVETRLRVCR